MRIVSIETPVIQSGDRLFPILLESLEWDLEDGDILAVASKVVAMEQGRVVDLSSVEPSPDAQRMKKLRYSKDFGHHSSFAELVLRESDKVFPGIDGYVYLTLKENIFIANAGIDLSNVPEGLAVLWPSQPWIWAREFRETLRDHFELDQLGVLVIDSHLVPLRRGVSGLALSYAGFEGIDSKIGHPDLYGRPLQVTEVAVADDLASASVLVTGEADESTPFAVIRDAPVAFTNRRIDPLETFIDPAVDLYAGIYNREFRQILNDEGI